MLQRLEATINQNRAGSYRRDRQRGSAAAGGGRAVGGGSVNRGQLQILLKPKDERKRSSDQIAHGSSRQLSGIPGVIVRASASGGNNQMNRFLSGGNNGGGRLSLEIRGEDLDDARKVAQAAKDMLDTVPNVADARLGRDDGRPELAVEVDRAEGGTPRRQRHDGREHASGRTSPARRPRCSARVARNTPSSSGCGKTSGRRSPTSSDVLVSTPQGTVHARRRI